MIRPLAYTPLALLASLAGLSAQNKSEKPNVVFILADDLGYGDIGCYGQKLIETPHIDALAKRGMLFTDFYAGCSVSAPSRASLMTGMHTGHTKIRGNKEIKPEGQEPMANVSTLGTLFQSAGYTTGIFGKWGLGYPGSGAEPQDRGFDRFFGYNCQRESHLYYPSHLWSNRDRMLYPSNQNNARRVYAPEEIQRVGLRFIEQSARERTPFFAMLTYTLPHAELNLPHNDLYKKYEQKLSPKPWESQYVGDYPSTPNAHASFAAMVEMLDRYVGQVCDKLRELGIEDNTLIIFTSDNGPHTEGGADPEYFDSNGPLRGTKRALYEGGIRVPMIAVWPEAIPAGRTEAMPAAFWDFHKTFTSLLGQREERNTDGINLLPTLTRRSKAYKPRSLYWEFHEQGGRQAIRRGKWKLIKQGVNTDKPTLELYDLSQDIGETNDLSQSQPKLVKALEKEMQHMRQPSEFFPFGSERSQKKN